MRTIIFGDKKKCPKCGKQTLKERHWGYQCFKCEHFMPRGQVVFIKDEWIGEREGHVA